MGGEVVGRDEVLGLLAVDEDRLLVLSSFNLLCFVEPALSFIS